MGIVLLGIIAVGREAGELAAEVALPECGEALQGGGGPAILLQRSDDPERFPESIVDGALEAGCFLRGAVEAIGQGGFRH